MNPFTLAYIECALWSSTDDEGNSLDRNFSKDDIHPATLKAMEDDCAAFVADGAVLLEASGLTDERQGHNFWLSRNGHGAGFFDDDQYVLQAAAKAWGSFDLYVGDDGKIHGS